MSIPQEEATARWDRNAHQWREEVIAENSAHRKYVLDPLVLELLGDIRGSHILDAGCGEGYLCRKLARLGARVTGVEVSREMLSFALEDKSKGPLGITYHQGDMTHMHFLPDNSFDFIITNITVSDAEDYKGAFREFARVLKPGGTYLHLDLHPCFNTPGGGWEKDQRGNKLYRRVDHYMERRTALLHWPGFPEPAVSYFRTLSDYYNALVNAGFTIEKMIEPTPSPQAVTQCPQISDMLRIPDFLVMVCKLPS